MRRVNLPETSLVVSRLSFGTASLHHSFIARNRRALLEAALAHGLTHFDTAPSYGFGIAERELGLVLKSERHRITLATKVGLYSPSGSHPNLLSVWTRKVVGKGLPRLSRAVSDWSVRVAKESFERSLRRMQTDYIDLVLLHEPDAALIDSDRFIEWFQEERTRGRIRSWGLAGDAAAMRPWMVERHPLCAVLQVRDSLRDNEADLIRAQGRELQITFGYLSSERHGDRQPDETVTAALARNPNGTIIVSTRRKERIARLAALAA